MSKIIKAAVAVAVLGAAGYAGATWYVGQHIDGKLDEFAGKLEGQKLVQVESREFQRGFWTSTETVTYHIGCENVTLAPLPREGLTLTVRNTVSHNPLGAGISTEILYDEEVRAKLDEVFKGQPPLSIHTRVGLAGGLTTELSSPAASLEEDGGKLQWKGLKGTIKYDEGFSYLKGDIELAGFDVQTPDGQSVQFGAIRSVSDQDRSPEGVYVGKGSLTWDGVNARLKGRDGRALNLVLGKGSFENVSDVKDGLLQAKFDGQFDQVALDGTELGVLSFLYSLDRIDAKAIKAHSDATWNDGRLQCNLSPQHDQQLLMKLLPALAAHDPALQMKVALKSPAGEGSYQLDLATQDVTEQDLANPMALMAMVNVTMTAQLPRALVKQLVTQFDPDNAGIVLAQFDMALDHGLQRGLVRIEGDLVKSQLVLKGGQIEINGQRKTMADFLR